jgi:hypothetical protein
MNAARYETEWIGFRLIVESRPDHFKAFVYDGEKCEVLYTAARLSLDAAKFAAVEFVAVTRFGPRHDLKPDVISTMLMWLPL